MASCCSRRLPRTPRVLAPGSRPTLSPWFGLYQRNGGPLDNYHTFVRPQIELRNTLLRQQAAIQRNSAGIASIDRDLGEQGQLHPTGTGSVLYGLRPLLPFAGRQRSHHAKREPYPPRETRFIEPCNVIDGALTRSPIRPRTAVLLRQEG